MKNSENTWVWYTDRQTQKKKKDKTWGGLSGNKTNKCRTEGKEVEEEEKKKTNNMGKIHVEKENRDLLVLVHLSWISSAT